jgi:hypothetical protein
MMIVEEKSRRRQDRRRGERESARYHGKACSEGVEKAW